MSYAKKYILTLVTILAIIFIGRSRLNTPSSTSNNSSLNSAQDSNSLTQESPSASSELSSSQSATNNSTGRYKDGTYKGQSADAYYGNVQVQAIIAGGKLTNINFLSYPNDNGRSQSINNYALPQLKSEAIRSQSAKVNAISGASFSSQAFVTSLQSALSQA